jgi:metal-responsive CopG/Arc/MetJ family transcriptional regulator
MAKPMKTVSFKLPEHLDDALDVLARRRSRSRSELVREALETFLASGGSSVTRMVDEVVGTVAGPTDLSTNRKHMTGYGR